MLVPFAWCLRRLSGYLMNCHTLTRLIIPSGSPTELLILVPGLALSWAFTVQTSCNDREITRLRLRRSLVLRRYLTPRGEAVYQNPPRYSDNKFT
jgi:hypothetical protein